MKRASVVVGVATLATTACTPLKMGVPSDLGQDADLIPITERSRMTGALANESFKLGPYQITSVKRGWNSSSSSEGPITSSGDAKTSYGFTFKSAQGEAQVKCGSKAASETVSLIVVDIDSSQVNVGCVCEGAAANARFNLGAENDSKLEGPVLAHGNNLTIAAVMQFANGVRSREPVGYEFRTQRAVSAVDVEMPGKVWMARSLDEQTRADLACLTAGLLLYQPPRKD